MSKTSFMCIEIDYLTIIVPGTPKMAGQLLECLSDAMRCSRKYGPCTLDFYQLEGRTCRVSVTMLKAGQLLPPKEEEGGEANGRDLPRPVMKLLGGPRS